jgi:hypothetical protein
MRSAAYKKQGAPDWHPLTSILYFYTHSAAYKKQGAPDWRPLISILCFLHMQHWVEKARGPDWRPLLSDHLILFVHAGLTNLDWCIIVLFIHISHQHMKSKGHLYIYIHQVFSKVRSTFYKLTIVYYRFHKRNYKALELLLSSDLARPKKSYKDTKSWAAS